MPRYRSCSTPTWRPIGVVALAVGCLVGCPKPDKPAENAKEKAPVAAEEAPKTPVVDNDDCVAPWSIDGDAVKIDANGRTFERTGAKLTETSSDDDKKAVIGVLANIKEDTEDNLENLDELLTFFEEKKVDAIVVVGDVGETKEQIENALLPIAAKGLPTFVVIGNREKKSDFNDALAAVAKENGNVVNLNQVRLAVLDDVALVSVPGYYDKAYIHAEDGCQYTKDDLAETKKIIAAAGDKSVVVLSHGPPKQEGVEALDRTLEQANVGDPALAKLLADAGVKFGVFSNIQEAGGRATNLAGSEILSADEPHDALFLNPGAADSVSWKMNDGSRSVGMAAVLTVDDGKGMFTIHRIEDDS